MLVEPLADVDVNVPGVMAILVAPAVTQLSVLLAPEFTFVGSAVKDVIVGTEPFPEGALDELTPPQPASPAQANRTRTSAQRARPDDSGPGELRVFLRNELVESMSNPKQSQSIAHAVVAVAACGPSPLDDPSRSFIGLLCVIRRSTTEFGRTPVTERSR